MFSRAKANRLLLEHKVFVIELMLENHKLKKQITVWEALNCGLTVTSEKKK